MRWLKVYPSLLRAYFNLSLEYRGQVVIWILSGILPLIMMLVWLSLTESGPVQGYTAQDFISYYLMVILMRRMCGVWIIWDLNRDIRMGNLSAQLLRPLDPVHLHLARTFARHPLQLILVGPPVAAAAFFLGARYAMPLAQLPLLLLVMLGAILIEFFVQMCIGALAFWITQAIAVMEVWFYIRALLSGWVVPIDLFPPAVTAALQYLPFRYVLSLPLEITLGRLTLPQIGYGLLVQYSWALFFFLLYRLLWARGIREYSAVGA
ncbi:MAG: ABC-2 family transporter protein [Anaerolineae bacterium]|nr:ABC-2 family transporter protein [Anaerolineae bacterium]